MRSVWRVPAKVMLAHAEEEDRERLLAGYESVQMADGRVQDLDALRADLERIIGNCGHYDAEGGYGLLPVFFSTSGKFQKSIRRGKLLFDGPNINAKSLESKGKLLVE